MHSLPRSVTLLALTALTACAAPQHPLEQQLSHMRAGTTAAPQGLSGPEGTLLCALTMYESRLPASEPMAERVNAFLIRKQFNGDEERWSLIMVKPSTADDDGIEQLSFNRGKYKVINTQQELIKAAESIPKNFRTQTCMPLAQARVLFTRGRQTGSFLISFGTEGAH